MALEEEYNVEIPSEDLAQLNTVEDVIKYLNAKGVELRYDSICIPRTGRSGCGHG